MQVKINDLTVGEIEEVAILHKENINTGFLSSLGINFLKLLYSSIQGSNSGLLVVVKNNEKVQGFVSGTINIKNIYLHLIKKKLVRGFILVFTKVLSIKKINRIMELLLYPVKKDGKDQIPDAELLSMAVNKNSREKGIGKILYNYLIEEFRKKEIYEFKIVVGDNLMGAQKFYDKMGAERVKSIEVHKKEKSWLYIQKIT